MGLFSLDVRGLSFSLRFLGVLLFLLGGVYATVSAVHSDGATERDPVSDAEHAALEEPLREAVRATLERRANRASPGPFSDTIRYTTAFDYMPETGPFVAVDQKTRKVTTYRDKQLVHTYDMLSAGKVGSPFYVKPGLYAVRTTDEKRSSSVGNVWLPYDVEFYDGFSVHGVPVYDDGTPVDERYAGDRIRLATGDAEALFSFATTGTGVFVYDDPTQEALRSVLPITVNAQNKPAVSARAFLVADVITGSTYLAKNHDNRYPIASITKLVTAVVTSEAGMFQESVRTDSGEHYRAGDLYYPLLLRSHNGIAEALAKVDGQRTFYGRMNNFAHGIGMYQTNFSDASGLSPHNRATANDLFALARYLYEKKRFLLDISKEKSMTIVSSEGTVWKMQNQNVLAKDAHFLGGKLGYTDEALQTSLALFMVPVGEEARTIAVIVLGSHDWKQDTRTLVSWLSEHASLVPSAPVE